MVPPIPSPVSFTRGKRLLTSRSRTECDTITVFLNEETEDGNHKMVKVLYLGNSGEVVRGKPVNLNLSHRNRLMEVIKGEPRDGKGKGRGLVEGKRPLFS